MTRVFEHHSAPLLPPRLFALRLVRFLLVGAGVDGLAIAVGAVLFRTLGGLSWLDATVDAAMVMTGNGPQHPIVESAGKLAMAAYAVAGGTIYLMVAALVLTPALHRLLHVLHLRVARRETGDEIGR